MGMGGTPGDIGEVPMSQVKQRKGCRMSCDVSKAVKRLRLILQPLHRFIYVTAHSPTLPPLYPRHKSFYSSSVASSTSQAFHLRHSSFSNPCAAASTLQLILQPLRRFIYATAHSKALPPLHLSHRSFYNPSVASPTSQALHVLHLASRPRIEG